MFESRDRPRLFWVGLALVLAGVLGFAVLSFVGTFTLGLFFCYSARPVYSRLRRRVGPPSVAAAVALFVLVLPVVLLFWYTAALGLGQLRSLAELDLASYEALLAPYTESVGLTGDPRELFQSLLADPQQVLREGRLRDLATQFATTATAFVGVVLTGLLHLFVALALAFYLLRDGDELAAWVRTHFPDATLVAYGREVDGGLKTVFFGNILNALVIGTVGAVVFSALAAVAPPEVSVPVPILLGLLAGAASLVPVVGMKLVYVPVSLYLLALSLVTAPATVWFPVVFFAVTFVVVDTIPEFIIRPYVSGRNLHVGSVMFAYILGPLLFGWYGLFLGPLLLVVVADFARVVVPALLGSTPAATSPRVHPDVEGPVPPVGPTPVDHEGDTADRDATDGDETTGERTDDPGGDARPGESGGDDAVGNQSDGDTGGD